MKLIIIHGGEASGKLTVAKALANKTGLALFDNHLSIDVANTLYQYGQSQYKQLVWQVRLVVFASAAKNNRSLIFTWAYSHPDFQPELDKIKTLLAAHGGEIHYVYLSCAQQELERRVQQLDRLKANKINTVAKLKQLQRLKNHQAIPGVNTLAIDNTDKSADAVADTITSHFELD